MNLQSISKDLCIDATHHCQICFKGRPTAGSQCPPNVFRTSNSDEIKLITFVFDKPNDNTKYKVSPLIPIVAFDDRAGLDPNLKRAPSHENLLILCRLLELIPIDSQDLNSSLIHITNAVKCDVSSDTGMTGPIKVSNQQAGNCIHHFLYRELEVVKSKAIVFFGVNAQKYVINRITPPWEIQTASINDSSYKIMRVPHTSPTSFNTHGGQGEKYKQPFFKLRAEVSDHGLPRFL